LGKQPGGSLSSPEKRMKRKPSKSGLNKLLAGDATLLSRDPLIGMLELDTESGAIELGIEAAEKATE
jgi:hypothetical protein